MLEKVAKEGSRSCSGYSKSRSLEVSGGPGRGGLVGSFRVTSAISLGTARITVAVGRRIGVKIFGWGQICA